MLEDDQPERIARTLDEVLEARDALYSYLEDRGLIDPFVGAIGVKGDYGIVVYLPKNIDPTFLVPMQIDGVPVRTAHLKTVDRIQPDELRALASWYDTHCSVSGDPILQGPCSRCGKLGSWEVDPVIEEIRNEEEWNFWCEDCYYARESEQI